MKASSARQTAWVHGYARLLMALLFPLTSFLTVGCHNADPGPYIRLIEEAQDQTKYKAVRQFNSFYGGAGQETPESYVEMIVRDEEGRFLLDLVSLGDQGDRSGLGGAHAPYTDLFQRFQRHIRMGLGRRIVIERDFRVRNSDLLIANYDIRVVAVDVPFLDRSTTQVSLIRKDIFGDCPSWLVRLDQETGIVLEYEEFRTGSDPTVFGETLSHMVCTTVDFDPDLVSSQFPDYDRVTREVLEPEEAAERVRGDFKVFEPKWLPRGFQADNAVLNQIDEVQFQGDVVQLSYTDGVSAIFIFQHRPLERNPVQKFASIAPEVEVQLFRHGSLSMCELILDDTYIHIEARVSAAALTTLVESLDTLLD